MAYQHGIRVQEQATSLVAPVTGTAGLQVVFGTAPVNLAADPYGVTNKPVIAYNWGEAVSQLGYSGEKREDGHFLYTLCASMYASFKLFNVAPVIFVNVLDTKKHKKDNPETTVAVESMEATVPITGILLDTVSITVDESEQLTEGEDYVLSFDDDSQLLVTLVSGGKGDGKAEIKVKSTSIDPTAVEADDIIGASSGNEEKGLEVIRQIYPRFGMIPGLIIAPGWSHIPDVGTVLAAKAKEINGYFSCEGFIDIDSYSTTGCATYSDVKVAKESAGCASEHFMPLWPCVVSGSMKFWYSAVIAAVTAYMDATNDDGAKLSPSNELLGITGTVLADAIYIPNEDGTGGTWDKEVVLDQLQGNAVNSFGVTTAINVNGWRTWGNNTAAYPATTDPKDRWFCCRRFFSWWGNSFILTYFQKVDNPANLRLVESIVDSENIRAQSYVPDKCAGAYIEFNPDENTTTDLLDGKLSFHTHLAPYTPAEYINNTLEFDPSALERALKGG